MSLKTDLPGYGTVKDDTTRLCSQCRYVNSDWSRYCAQCGKPLGRPVLSNSNERAHIVYLLEQIPKWRYDRLVSEENAWSLTQRYAGRRAFLEAECTAWESGPAALQASRQEEQPVTAQAPVPQAPTEAPKQSVPSRPPIMSYQPAPEHAARLPEAVAAVRPQQLPPPVLPAPRQVAREDASSQENGLRVFFQEHALKLLFALATVLVLVALRSMLAWEWVNRAGILMIPAIPLGLSLAFWVFGQKTRQDNPWAAFVYHGLTAALAAFDVLAVNKYWLAGAMTARPAFLAASLASAAAAGVLLLRRREIPYLHLFHVSALTALYAFGQAFRTGAAHNDVLPMPIGLFGGLYLAYAAVCLAIARRTAAMNADLPLSPDADNAEGTAGNSEQWTLAWSFCAHFAVLLCVVFASISVSVGQGIAWSSLAALALVSGIVYGAGAQALGSPEMARASGVLVAGASVLDLAAGNAPDVNVLAVCLMALCTTAWLLARYNRRRSEASRVAVIVNCGTELAEAYRQVCLASLYATTVVLWAGTLYKFVEPAGIAGPRLLWVTGLLAFVCGGLHLRMAKEEEQSAYVFGGLFTWGLMGSIALHLANAPAAAFALSGTLYGAALCLWSHLARKRSADEAADTLRISAFEASGLIFTALGALGAMQTAARQGMPHEWPVSMAALLSAALVFGAMAQVKRWRELVWGAAICAVGAGAVAANGFVRPDMNLLAAGMLALSIVARVLYRVNRGAAESASADSPCDAVARAYRQICLLFGLSGGALIWLHALHLMVNVSPAVRTVPLVFVGLLSLAYGAYALRLGRDENPAVCLTATIGFWGLAIAVALTVAGCAGGAYPFTLAAYAATLFGAAALIRRRVGAEDTRSTTLDVCGLLLMSGCVAASVLLAARDGLRFEWVWTAAVLTLAALLYSAMTRAREWPCLARASVACAAGASALLVWHLAASRYLPEWGAVGFSLTPFILVSAVATFYLSRRPAGNDAPERLRRDALTVTGIAAFVVSLISFGNAMWRFDKALNLGLLACLASAALLAASWREPEDRIYRGWSLAALFVGAGLWTFAFVGLLDRFADLALGWALLAWGWQLVGMAIQRRAKADVWSGGLTSGALVTGFMAALAAALECTGNGVCSSGGPAHVTPIESAFVLVIALNAMHIYRTRRPQAFPMLLAAQFLAGTGTLGVLFGNGPIDRCSYPHLLPLAMALTAAAAGICLLLARRLEQPGIARWSYLAVAAVGLLAPSYNPAAFARVDLLLCEAVVIMGCSVFVPAYLRAARWSDRKEFTCAAAIVFLGAWLQTTGDVWHLRWGWAGSDYWTALLALPAICAVALFGESRRGTNEHPIGAPARRIALTASLLAVFHAVAVSGIATVFADGGPWGRPSACALTLAVYGAVYAVYAFRRRTPRSVCLAASTLAAAYLCYLLPQAAVHAISWPRCAFLGIQSGVVWLIVGTHLKRNCDRCDLAVPLLWLARIVAGICAGAALCSVETPGQGAWTILTLAWCGAICFGMWLLEEGVLWLHAGTWSLLAAWALIVRHWGGNMSTLDAYLLPIGLYLITIGQAVSRREERAASQAFWWAGVLLMMTPAFFAYWQHAGAWHTILLLTECLAALLWGIAQRIRAFVYASLGFAAAYSASASVGHLPETWGTVISLLIGVGLFVAGFYALTHREVVQRAIASAERTWRRWQEWR